jgi:phosphopantetheinyl transferase
MTARPARAYYCRSAGIAGDQLDVMWSWLSADERARHDQRSGTARRQSFAVAHAVLRRVLADATGSAPAQLTFDRDRYGKPFVVPDGDNPPPAFSLSHCHDVVACVVAGTGRVGIDVEPITSSIDAIGFARRFFPPAEASWVEAAAPLHRASRFYALWTLKEALSKALGYGLGLPLTSTSFAISADAVSVALSPPFDDDMWHCASIDLGGTHMVGVVANSAAASAPLDLLEVNTSYIVTRLPFSRSAYARSVCAGVSVPFSGG